MRRHLGLLVCVSLSACLWRSYVEILTVHLTVLTQMADKLGSLAEAGHAPTAADMAEFTYPAQRGRQFLRQFSRYADRQSYRGFTQFLDRYEVLLKRVDAARVSESTWTAERPRVAAERQALAALAAATRGHLNE